MPIEFETFYEYVAQWIEQCWEQKNGPEDGLLEPQTENLRIQEEIKKDENEINFEDDEKNENNKTEEKI